MDDPDWGEPNTAVDRYGFHEKGFRFMCWPDPDDEGDVKDELEERADRADLFGPDPVLVEAAASAAASLGAISGNETRWRPIAANGGAGDNWLVDLVQVVGGSLASILVLLQSPKAAREAWEVLSAFYAKLAANKRGDEWHAGVEVAVFKCIDIIRSEVDDPDIVPDAIRVVQDGTDAGMWSDMAIGTHAIIVPELRQSKTYIFVVDSQLQIHGRLSSSPHVGRKDARGPG